MSIVQKAHQHLKHIVKTGDIAIDATFGKGYDTLFLAEKVGVTGKVYGFDIQPIALEITQELLKKKNLSSQVELFLESHEKMENFLPPDIEGKVKAIIFNLGYLPQTDKKVITQPETTLPALDFSLTLLCPQGRLIVTVYLGHKGGSEEWEAVKRWIDQIDLEQFKVAYEFPQPEDPTAPKQVIIERT